MKRLLLMLSFALLAANLTQAQDFDRREYRAVWLTTFLGLDWPKGHDPLTQQKQLCRILDQLQAAKVNTVLFQVRLRGTTAYASDIERPDDAPLTTRWLLRLRNVTAEEWNCTRGW